MLLAAASHARRSLARFLAAARDATRVQDNVLRSKLRSNADSEFGRRLGLSGVSSYQDFVRRVPVLQYEDLSPWIEKAKSGDLRALLGPRQRVHMFAKTSGTTDRPKYIPVTNAFLREYRRGWNAFGVKAIMDHPGSFLRHIVQMSSPMDEERSSGGYCCGAITGLMAATQKRLVRRYYVVPAETAYIPDSNARYYTAMRFAVPADVAFMITASPATQLRLARTADAHGEELIRDVHDGTLSARMEIPAPLRRRLTRRLRPDPVSATRLAAVRARTGRLLPKDYWDLGFLANWIGGTMGLYLGDFPEFFGDVPVRDIGLLASEGRMSIPMSDGTPAGVLDVTSNFYEFIPVAEYGSAQPTILRAHEVEVGEEYFILLTTSAGFYRYDIGDCVRVTDFYGQAPVIEFLHKGVHVSSLSGEKLTEQQVVLAFDRAVRRISAPRLDFVLAPRWDDPPGYVLHLERTEGVDSPVLERLVSEFDRSLEEINLEYRSKRRSGRLQQVLCNLLPHRWLAERDQRIAQRHRAANEQYKHRYLLAELGADAEFPVAGHPRSINGRQPASGASASKCG